MKEQLSGFVDNELSEFEERRLLSAMSADPQLRETWERYHLIRAVMRNEIDFAAHPELADRVTSGLQGAGGATPWIGRAAKVAGTLAIAASVAALTIVGLYTLNRPAGTSTEVATATKAPGTATTREASNGWTTERPDVEKALNNYLAEHNEYAGNTGVGGVMPSIRSVGYDNTRDR